MTISILTLFPEIFSDVLNHSILSRAQKKGIINFNLINIRDFSTDKHKTVDDKPYGGGVGMLLRVDVVQKAISYTKKLYSKAIKKTRLEADRPMDEKKRKSKTKIILLDPTGKIFTQTKAQNYTMQDHLILVCGHYEGIDHRIIHFVDERISVGEYILTGGEIPAMVVADSVTRLLPGVLNKKQATTDESFSSKMIYEPPQYTKPANYKGLRVPEVLLSGNHKKISVWKAKKAKR